ncbi:MAG: leucine-rich repeat protein [Clostridia bacterium]|nr:leucine-rich repeat protein [Clostridia bacterium]
MRKRLLFIIILILIIPLFYMLILTKEKTNIKNISEPEKNEIQQFSGTWAEVEGAKYGYYYDFNVMGIKISEVVLYDDEVIIPETIGNYTVKGIDNRAFINNTYIKSVTIPKTVEYIGESAFEGCTNLTKVKFKDIQDSQLFRIDDNAFKDCINLKSIVLPKNLVFINEYVFEGCSNLRSVIYNHREETSSKAFFKTNSSDLYLIYYNDVDGYRGEYSYLDDPLLFVRTEEITESDLITINKDGLYASIEIGRVLENADPNNTLGFTLKYKTNNDEEIPCDNNKRVRIDDDLKVLTANLYLNGEIFASAYLLNFDLQAPYISNPNEGKWTNKPFRLILSSGENEEYIDHYEYKYSGSDWIKYGQLLKVEDGVQTTNFELERNEYVYIRAVDITGRISPERNTMIQIDTTEPETPTIQNPNNQKWVNEIYSINLKSKDNLSGLDHFEYGYMNKETNEIDWHPYNQLGDNVTSMDTTPFQHDRQEAVYIKAVDKAGNESKASTTEIWLDKIQPKISKITLTTDNKITITANDPKDKDTNTHSNIAGFIVTETNEQPSITSNSWKNLNITVDSAINFTTEETFENGKKYYVWLKDNAGNISLPAQIKIKTSIEPPKPKEGLEYSGQEQTGVEEGEGYTVTNGKATNANVGDDVYIATIELKDKTNTEWSTGGTENITIPWRIERAKTAEVSAENKQYTGNEITGVTGQNVTLTGTTKENKVGEYTATATPASNYAWEDGTTTERTLTWKIYYKVTYQKETNVTRIEKNGNEIEQEEITGRQLILPEIIVPEGYTGKWYNGDNLIGAPGAEYTIDNNITLTAKAEANTYTVNFDSNGGSQASPTSITKKYGETIGTLPTTTKDGDIFKGWWTAQTGGEQITADTTMPLNGATYYAHWEKESDEEYINFGNYEEDGNSNYIEKIPVNTSYQTLKNNIQTNMQIRINNKENTDLIKTGDKLIVTGNNTETIYTLIVTGDTNKDGKADIHDIFAINKHRRGKVLLQNESLKAGDVTGDGKADIHDIFKINKFRRGKISSL